MTNGGLNPMTSPLWDEQTDAVKKHAKDTCQTLVYTGCWPKHGNPNSVCKAYLAAAKQANYLKMFVGSTNKIPYKLYDTEFATQTFKKEGGPDNFIENYGDEWTFCKLKKN